MSAYERQLKQMEKEDNLRLQSAIDKIEEDPDLRFLMRLILDTCGYGSAPIGTDALTMARSCGMIAVAAELVGMANQYSVTLYPTLVKEANDERHSRDKRLDNASSGYAD